jgi:hypothetical protein
MSKKLISVAFRIADITRKKEALEAKLQALQMDELGANARQRASGLLMTLLTLMKQKGGFGEPMFRAGVKEAILTTDIVAEKDSSLFLTFFITPLSNDMNAAYCLAYAKKYDGLYHSNYNCLSTAKTLGGYTPVATSNDSASILAAFILEAQKRGIVIERKKARNKVRQAAKNTM